MTDHGTIDVKASARRRGDRVEVQLLLEMPENTHIEPHEPPDPFLIPTVVELEDLEVDSIVYPEPTEKDIGLPGAPLLVYRGGVRITAQARADARRQTLRGTIRYQPCVGSACLPPRTQRWEAAVR